MAPAARIRRPELHAQIGPRDAKAVVPPRIDRHIGRLRHVAIHTQSAWLTVGMTMVDRPVVFAWRMLVARRANLISFVLEPGGMRVMTIGALNPLVIHLALHERAVFIDLVENLPVSVVARAGEEL